MNYSIISPDRRCPAHCREQLRGVALAVNAPMQGHCTTWPRYGIAVAQRAIGSQGADMLLGKRNIPLCPPDAAAIGYTFLRHLGLMLDELSAQGLEVWRDEDQAWQ